MATNAKKLISMLLAVCLCMGMGLQALAVEYEARIGETDYETFVGAVNEANGMPEEKDAEGNVISIVIELLKDIVLKDDVVIKNDITISGGDTDNDGVNEGHTITRDDKYTGTLITVDKNNTLTLDDGVILDGGNEWTFDKEEYYEDVTTGESLANSQSTYTHSEEGGIVATAPMINVAAGSEVVVEDATIQNNYSNKHNDIAVFNVKDGATVTIEDGAEIKHIRNSVFGIVNGTVDMNGGKIQDVFAHDSNAGVVYVGEGGEFNMNGGEITEVRTFGPNTGGNGNGIIAQVYGEKAKMTMTGGEIHDNVAYCPGRGWGSAIYLNRGGDFTMTGGVIKDTISDGCTAFAANAGTTIELLGGTIEIEKSTNGGYASFFYGDITVGEKMDIIGEKDALFAVLGDKGHDVKIDGEISGDGTMWLCTTEPVTGKGTVTSDVLIKADDWMETPGQVTLGEANWNCYILVDSVGSGASLTVQPGANVTGGVVRILESVDSGDYTNPEEAAKAQDSAYDKKDGANVTSPVLYYHRLLPNQKNEIVVTFDYNGGLDEQGWSGCQVTGVMGENGFVPTSPLPKFEGKEFAGWKYAVDNDPETFNMDGDAMFEGEGITKTLRLVAQWNVPEEDKKEEDKIIINEEDKIIINDEPTPLDESPAAPEEQYEVPSETETILDEDVPLAEVPGLGDETAIWMLVVAFAIFGLVVINLPKRKCEDD